MVTISLELSELLESQGFEQVDDGVWEKRERIGDWEETNTVKITQTSKRVRG